MDLVQLSGPGDYIGGRFTEAAVPDAEICVTSPADTRDVLARYAFAHGQVDAAVHAARTAWPSWRRLGEAGRSALLRGYQAQLRAQRDTLAQVLSREVGKALWDAQTEIDAMIGKVDLALGEGGRFTATQVIGELGEIRYAPLGVVAVLGPFNFPGHLPNGQIVPALFTGNCVVHKPSERTPCTATLIARCMHAAGIPEGVFNVVQGDGALGAKLAQHEGVDGVLFTGSVEVGRRIAIANAARPDRLVALELGGKNVSVALDDCDLERTARCVAFAAFVSAGQRCTATSRLFVTAGVAERLIARVAELARFLRVGYVLDDGVFMGPVISEAARQALLAAQVRARDAGFEDVVAGGAYEVPGREGFYMAPRIGRAPSPELIVAGYSDRELFGPDLAVHVVRDEEEALELAARSQYGLAAGVFTASRAAFERAADRLRVGVLCWNRPTAGASGRLPFGGVGESGNHRPAGILAGLTCTDPVGVLLTPGHQDPLPSWPGLPFAS